jgi:2-oxoglutarate dehydrogenase E2 component (dihydrolipoamide succinyltransferase)
VREIREKMTTRRKRIAENLSAVAAPTAHLTTFNEIDMSAVSRCASESRARREGARASSCRSCRSSSKARCMALKPYPIVNAQIDGDTIVYKHYVNMGIAVASTRDSWCRTSRTPIARASRDRRDIGAVAKRARDGKLTMDDLTGGTFTITNGGVFGSLVSTPIINYPQVGILGLHKIAGRPVR